MDTSILVSIIIPVYNVKPYLEEALDSVVHQSYENLEIIIVDDGSTDGSGEICDKYAAEDRRIKLIHQENRGLSAARNTGLNIMSGEYVAFLDSDDAFHIDYVKVLLSAALREKVDIAVCRYTRQKTVDKLKYNGRESKEPSLIAGVYDRFGALRALVDSRLNDSVWNKLYHANLWEDTRYPDGQVYEDIATTFRILDCCESVCVIDRELYMKRERHGSITDTLTQKNCIDWQLSYSAYESFVDEKTPTSFSYEQLQRVRSTRIHTMIMFFIRSREKKSNQYEDFWNQLRKQIIKLGDEDKVQYSGLRDKTAYRLLCISPELLQITYLVYRPVRQLVHRCTGR